MELVRTALLFPNPVYLLFLCSTLKDKAVFSRMAQHDIIQSAIYRFSRQTYRLVAGVTFYGETAAFFSALLGCAG
jgi:hypothetical protein